MKKAFLKMSQEHTQGMGAAAAHSPLIDNMMVMLQEQQDAFMQCTSTFDHGLMVAFAIYHAIYAAYFMHGLVTWGPYESQQLKTIAFSNRQQVFINKSPLEVKEEMHRQYRQRTVMNTHSPCEMIFNTKTFLIAFGFGFCYYGVLESFELRTTCLNYTNIPLIWTLFEVISFFIWLLVSFTALWQYS
jgi:hypothetical protein